jgi:hypothetical protein
VVRPPDGSRVVLSRDALIMDGGTIDLSKAASSSPSPLSPLDRAAAATFLATASLAISVPGDIAEHWQRAHVALSTGQFDQARQLLQGRGGGLTPTGDDMFAGALVVARVVDPTATYLEHVADALVSSALSRSFVRWAARGHSVTVVHDLIAAAARGDLAVFDALCGQVREIGGSSGTALLLGIFTTAQWLVTQK